MPDTPSEPPAQLAIDLHDAEKWVKVRLVPHSDVEASPVPLVTREALPGLDGVLVYELEDRLVPVSPDQLATFADEPDEVWQAAYDRVADEHVPDIDVEELAEGIPVMVLQSQSMFCATNACWPERFLEVPPDGLLVGVPNRHLVWIHAIRDEGVVHALSQLVIVAKERFNEVEEGGVSADLFWWHDGTFIRIESNMAEVDGETQLAIGLPDELVDIFNQYIPAAPPDSPGEA